jgi:hypothetical protein
MRRVQRNNSSGFTGAYWSASAGGYCAQIRAGGKTKSIGTYATAEEANEARIAAINGIGQKKDIRSRFDYDPATGAFKFRYGRKAGKVAGFKISNGAICISFNGKRVYAHRAAVFFMTGHWPVGDVDHRDLDRANNAWSNLRECSRQQNAANSRARSHNKIGLKGVAKENSGRFRAGITVCKKKINLGTFDSAEEAHSAYVAAAFLHFGEFARPS